MRYAQRLGFLASCLLLVGCSLFPTGFGERDQYVVSTPHYYDNRVFYVAAEPNGHAWPLKDAFAARTQASDKARIKHGSPLSIILNSVSMPAAETDRRGKPIAEGTR